MFNHFHEITDLFVDFATRVELPVRVYSAGRCCQDCDARRSNDALGQRATIVYARLAHGPSGGGRRSGSPPHSPPPLNILKTTHILTSLIILLS